MFNFYSYFISVAILVYTALIGWFLFQYFQEKKLLDRGDE